MKLLWLCNNAPGAVRSVLQGKEVGGVNWVDHVLQGVRQQGITLRILYRGTGGEGAVDERCTFASFGEEAPWVYRPELEDIFRRELRSFQPDVIHSWGVEYDHALAMVRAAEQEGMLDRMAASIQGLCHVLAEHYLDGIPQKVQNGATFRDLLRKDSLMQQKEKFVLRGRLETQALAQLHHVLGRTAWDREKTARVNPKLTYHFCNETLRECFYEGQWAYGRCVKHQVFASSCSYPIKGFHYLLQAMGKVRRVYPDASITVTGRSFLAKDFKGRLRRSGYEAYLARLARENGLENAIIFLGSLSAREMKQAYLQANVFVLPSTMENSPNSLGEAMLLGLPCVAARVGGVEDLLENGAEGRIYDSGDVDALAAQILELFRMEEQAAAPGLAARDHARKTHDPRKNLEDLLNIYESLRNQGGGTWKKPSA